MKHRSPLVTLAAMAAFFAALLIADFVVHPGTSTAGSAPTVSTAATPSAAARRSASATDPSPGSTAPPSTAPSSSAAPTPTSARDDEETLPHQAVYVGRTDNRILAVAVAVLGDRAVAYVCDGRSREAWLRGSVDGDEITLTSKSGYRITAELDDDGRLQGRVRHDGRSWKFELTAAKRPAGLYRGEGSKSTIGWIRLPDGSLVGVATSSQGSSTPAPPIPADDVVVVGGEQITAAPVDGDADF